jgi:hypothetical protein
MTTIMPIDEPRPRGTVMGKQVTGPRLSEAVHSGDVRSAASTRSGMA